jgi:hypothetical protein
MEGISAGPANTNICILLASDTVIAAPTHNTVISLATTDIVTRETPNYQFTRVGTLTDTACDWTIQNGGQNDSRAGGRFDIIGSYCTGLICKMCDWHNIVCRVSKGNTDQYQTC